MWDCLRIQNALRCAEVVSETRMTDAGPGPWYSLKLDDKIIPLGIDQHFADGLVFALRRNAEAFERK